MITKKLLKEWGACWSDEQIDTYLKSAKRKSVSPRHVAQDTTISLDDRLWVLCKTLAHLSEPCARYFAIECAQTVAHLAGDEGDQAQYLGLLNQLCEIEDLPEQDRDAARAAAWAAAWDAARAAALDVAWAAARAAALDVAWDAAWAAAWAAARAAAWAAAWDVALTAAIDRALIWLGDFAEGF